MEKNLLNWPGLIECSQETVRGERYLVFKVPARRPINEILSIVRQVWVNAGARPTGRNSFYANDLELGLKTYFDRKEWINKKISRKSAGKKKVRRSKASEAFHLWVKKEYAKLKKVYRHETKTRLAETIYENHEHRINSLKARGKTAPRHYSLPSIRKILSQ